jgi:hypothetical protein
MWNSTAAAASSSAAASAVNDYGYDNEEEPEEEVSDDLVVLSNNGNKDDEDNNTNNNVEDVFFCPAQDIQNQMSPNVRTAAMEDRRFRKLFGVNIGIVLHVWYMMEEDDLLPKKSKPKHLMWTLYFMKVYPQEAPACSAVGGSGGGVDPKTLQ